MTDIDKQEVLKFLELSEANGLWYGDPDSCLGNFQFWIAYFRHIRSCSADESLQETCLGNAELLARSESDWLECARSRARFCGDKDQVRSCLQKAEEIICKNDRFPSIDRLCECARLWKSLLADADEAIRILKFAEGLKTAALSRNMLELAEAWNFVSSDKTRARSLLLKAEQKSSSSCEALIKCAETWINIFSDVDKASDCIRLAEESCSPLSDLCDCARAWINLCNRPDEAERCLRHSESIDPACVYTLIECSKVWKNLLANPENAKKDILLAEKVAESKTTSHPPFREWLSCAEAWKEILDDDENARRCLELAEKEAV